MCVRSRRLGLLLLWSSWRTCRLSLPSSLSYASVEALVLWTCSSFSTEFTQPSVIQVCGTQLVRGEHKRDQLFWSTTQHNLRAKFSGESLRPETVSQLNQLNVTQYSSTERAYFLFSVVSVYQPYLFVLPFRSSLFVSRVVFFQSEFSRLVPLRSHRDNQTNFTGFPLKSMFSRCYFRFEKFKSSTSCLSSCVLRPSE